MKLVWQRSSTPRQVTLTIVLYVLACRNYSLIDALSLCGIVRNAKIFHVVVLSAKILLPKKIY